MRQVPDSTSRTGQWPTLAQQVDHGGRIDITYSQNVHTSQIRPWECGVGPISGYKMVAANNHSHQVLASQVFAGTCFQLQIADIPGHNERYMGTVDF